MGDHVPPQELDYVRIDDALVDAAVRALEAAERLSLKVVTAESCTGGLIATLLSEAPGAAEYFDGGFVCYTPAQKSNSLGIEPEPDREMRRGQRGGGARHGAGRA